MSRKRVDKIHGKFRKKIFKKPKCAAQNIAELEPGEDSRRGEMCTKVKYWLYWLRVDTQGIVRSFY